MSEYEPHSQIDAIAATTIIGYECAYEDCEAEADWLVELDNGQGFVCCQPCSRQNRIYARENDLYKSEVSEQVWEALRDAEESD